MIVRRALDLVVETWGTVISRYLVSVNVPNCAFPGAFGRRKEYQTSQPANRCSTSALTDLEIYLKKSGILLI